MLNLAQVQTFLAVVDEGGIQAAAQQLNCSQPAVSQQLKKLEEFLASFWWYEIAVGRYRLATVNYSCPKLVR